MAFTPANIPFDLWVGNHKTLIRRFKTTENGVELPIDLSSAVVIFTVYNGDTKLIEKSTTLGTVLVQGADNNELSVTLTPANTRTIAAAVYDEGVKPTHEFEVRLGGTEETWVYGKIKLKGGDNVDA